MTKADDLLPCPFCGGKAERVTVDDSEPDNAGGDVICCESCRASSHVEFGRKENLVSSWNKRTESEQLRIALRSCVLFSDIAAKLADIEMSDVTFEVRVADGGKELARMSWADVQNTARAVLARQAYP